MTYYPLSQDWFPLVGQQGLVGPPASMAPGASSPGLIGPPMSLAPGSDAGPAPYTAMQNISAVGAAAGLVTAAIGAYASSNAQKHQLRSQASSLDYQQQMSQLNARAAENDAQEILRAGNQQIGLVGMRYAQEKASIRASTAGRGVVLGEGNAAEVQASISLARDIDIMTLRTQTVREATNARLRGVNARAQGAAAGASAANMRATASSINPALQAHTTLIGGIPAAANYFAPYDSRRRRIR